MGRKRGKDGQLSFRSIGGRFESVHTFRSSTSRRIQNKSPDGDKATGHISIDVQNVGVGRTIWPIVLRHSRTGERLHSILGETSYIKKRGILFVFFGRSEKDVLNSRIILALSSSCQLKGWPTLTAEEGGWILRATDCSKTSRGISFLSEEVEFYLTVNVSSFVAGWIDS